LQDVRNAFSRYGGSLGESGCVAWLFDPKGLLIIETNGLDAEGLALDAIDAGAEDIKVENNYVEIYTKPDELETVRTALEQKKLPIASAELSMVPKTMVELDEKAALQTLKLLDKLEELDEVQQVSSNADFPDAILEKYRSGA
jgi:transcriptional/translational regulatory protein YebC/TACO1